MKKIGKGSWEQFWLTYKSKPGSLAVLICVLLAAIVTVGILFSPDHIHFSKRSRAFETGAVCLGI